MFIHLIFSLYIQQFHSNTANLQEHYIHVECWVCTLEAYVLDHLKNWINK